MRLGSVVLVAGLAFLPVAVGADTLAHTFSIVARDPLTGDLGVAVQSHWPGVGAMVAWARAGVGAVATQSFVRPRYGPDILAALERGLTPEAAFREAAEGDGGRAGRQVGVIDAKGRVFAYTGEGNIPVAHHLTGDGFSVQANLMVDAQVVPAMAAAFRQAQGPLAGRLVAALRAGQDAGGDLRGRQSASLLVVAGEATGDPEHDRRVDLRVDDHSHPVQELARLLALRQAYDLGNEVQAAIRAGRRDHAQQLWRALEASCPDCHEPRFWVAVAWLTAGDEDEARRHMLRLLEVDGSWGEVLRRLPAAGLLPGGAEGQALLERVLPSGDREAPPGTSG